VAILLLTAFGVRGVGIDPLTPQNFTFTFLPLSRWKYGYMYFSYVAVSTPGFLQGYARFLAPHPGA